jgi:hypothetical protein
VLLSCGDHNGMPIQMNDVRYSYTGIVIIERGSMKTYATSVTLLILTGIYGVGVCGVVVYRTIL